MQSEQETKSRQTLEAVVGLSLLPERPTWNMNRKSRPLEFDFYCKDLKLGIEIDEAPQWHDRRTTNARAVRTRQQAS